MRFSGRSESTNLAAVIFAEALEGKPIYDYHTHLSAHEILEDKPFSSLSEAMLARDHYKWRMMRYAGLPERVITGDASEEEKFLAWASVCERAIGSPMKAWTEFELKLFFGIEEKLTIENASEIFRRCQRKIELERIGPRSILRTSNVKLVCTTDDPVDDLDDHFKLREEGFEPLVLPTFRPDKALKITAPSFTEYVRILEEKSNLKIRNVETMLCALEERLRYFLRAGCRLSDHSVETIAVGVPTADAANRVLRRRLGGEGVAPEEASEYSTFLLAELAKLYAKYGTIMQLHVGALRNVNSKAYGDFGPDAGFDVPNDFPVAQPIANLFDYINNSAEAGVPKTVIYALNPKDYHSLAIVAQAFSTTTTPGHIQLGPAWWFNDNRTGIRLHLETLANQGMLPSFIGMVTDSRSFLSMARHLYFRLILADFLAELAGLEGATDERSLRTLTELASDIAWRNAKLYILGS